MTERSTLAADLRRDGAVHVPGVLPLDFVARLRLAADEAGERWAERKGGATRAQGSMVGVPQLEDPVFGELIASPQVLGLLADLDLPDPTFTDGYVISKPGSSPRLFWHLDWYHWDEERAFEVEPIQVFVMAYLTPTRPENGCLRFLPGSHVRRHPLHDGMADGHVALARADDLDRAEFADVPGEREVRSMPGDLVVGDARLLHAAHANTVEERRSLITLWFQPRYDQLSPRMKATMVAKAQQPPPGWPDDVRTAVEQMLPTAHVDAEPYGRTVTGPRP